MNRISRSSVERLESRQLLSSTSIPSIFGSFSGFANFTSGQSDSLVIDVTSQKNGSFSGQEFQGTGVTSRIKGSINKKGIVHANVNGLNVKFSSKVVGALSGDTFAATFSTKQGKLRLTGVFSVTRATQPG